MGADLVELSFEATGVGNTDVVADTSGQMHLVLVSVEIFISVHQAVDGLNANLRHPRTLVSLGVPRGL